jgi:hypothetical protein
MINPVSTRAIPIKLVRNIFKKAILYSLSLNKLNVSRLKVENVVYPPRTPINKNIRILGDTEKRSDKPQSKPIIKEPERLTIRVLTGKTPEEYL